MTTRTVSFFAALLLAGALFGGSLRAADARTAVEQARQSDRFAFVLFYRTDDASTGSMLQMCRSTLGNRTDATIVPVQIADPAGQALVAQFDATRLPMPAVAVVAPNGAVTSVFPRRVTAQQLTAAIVSPGQAACLKAIQDEKIVLLCAQPEGDSSIPQGVSAFLEDELFRDRSELIIVRATDPAEAVFLAQLQLRTDHPTTLVAFMAPPGVLLGTYNAQVTHSILARKLAAAGKCCEDPNCKHHREATGSAPPSR
jgi:hypothetical protein